MVKDEWYEEILGLDPSSRVFLPFAKQLAAEGRQDKAVAVLRRGLQNNPVYTEARIWLVHMLNEQGAFADAEREAAPLALLFEQCHGFWGTLSRMGANRNEDAGLILRLLETLTRRRDVTISGIFAHGVDAIAGKLGEPFMPAPQTSAGIESDTSVADASAEVSDMPIPSTGERLSLRTRSMAEVLAEQGDIAGAIEIYRELSESNPDDTALFERISELSEHFLGEAGASGGNSDQGEKNDKDEKNTDNAMQYPKNTEYTTESIIEKLAERLEERAERLP